jgi:hypothetical protein
MEDNIKMGLKEISCKAVDWTHLVQDRDHRWALVNSAKNLWVP